MGQMWISSLVLRMKQMMCGILYMNGVYFAGTARCKVKLIGGKMYLLSKHMA